MSNATHQATRALASLCVSQKQALYSAAYEGDSDNLSILGCTGLVGLRDYQLQVTDLGRDAAALLVEPGDRVQTAMGTGTVSEVTEAFGRVAHWVRCDDGESRLCVDVRPIA